MTQFVDRSELTMNVKEVEAEMTAYLVISTLELPGKVESRGYIQSWLAGGELTDTMARRIMGAADKIISAGMRAGRISRRVRLCKQERCLALLSAEPDVRFNQEGKSA